MARKKRSSRKQSFKPKKAATALWYVLTTASASLLAALLIGLVLGENDPATWMIVTLIVDVLFIMWLIYTRRFTTSETIAWGRRR